MAILKKCYYLYAGKQCIPHGGQTNKLKLKKIIIIGVAANPLTSVPHERTQDKISNHDNNIVKYKHGQFFFRLKEGDERP